MTPNQVTAARVAAAFTAVAIFSLWSDSFVAGLFGVALTVMAIALDALDGHLARSLNLATPLGAQLDILGDRLVENVFFTFFAVAGLVSLWVPVVFFARGTLTDLLRSLAANHGRSGFGSLGMLQSWWGRALVASRSSRAAYAALKCICFCFLGLLVSISHLPPERLGDTARAGFTAFAQILVGITVVFCLVRALPVFWEGRSYLAATPRPAVLSVTETSR